MVASVEFFPFYPPPSDQHPLPSPPPPSHIVPSPPPPSSCPPPPHHPIQPPTPSHYVPPPPPPPLPHFSPPPYPRPPPPHVLPPPPPPPHHHVIIVVVISLGSLFFLAFLAAALFCYVKKRRMQHSVKTKITKFDEHLKVEEVIVPGGGPHGELTRVVMIEEDIHLEEDILKAESFSRAPHLTSTQGHALNWVMRWRWTGTNHHLTEHKGLNEIHDKTYARGKSFIVTI